MKKLFMLSSLIGCVSLLSSCVVDPYGNVIAGGPGYYAGGPGYYDGPVGPYGEPYFIYGSTHYYYYGGRYCYYDRGHRVYVQHLPSGGHYYRNSGHRTPSNYGPKPAPYHNTGGPVHMNNVNHPYPYNSSGPQKAYGKQPSFNATRQSGGPQGAGNYGKPQMTSPPKNVQGVPDKKKRD